MQQRLEEFLYAEGLTKAQFADSINVARAAISHIVAGRNKPSYEFIVNTMKAFPELNIEWLLCGKGTMYKDGKLPSASPGDDLFSSPVVADQPQILVSEPEPAPVIQVEAPEEQVEVPASVDISVKQKTTTAQIKRIVVYYSDGTYKDYVPED